MNDWLAKVVDSTASKVVAVLITLAIPALLGWVFHRVIARFVGWFRWRLLILSFGFRCWRNRRGLRLVTLDDYVYILERLRRDLVRLAEGLSGSSTGKPKISVHVFSMQLPRDWPLWDRNIQRDTPGKDALERYFFHFNDFLRNQETMPYSVAVRRVTVIDNRESPRGKERMQDLITDVNSETFNKYVALLHNDEEDACCYLYSRPWPSWLSDCVFFGISGATDGRTWVWAVTTTYNPKEDLLLLGLHRLGAATTPTNLPLPVGTTSLEQLADSAGRDDIVSALTTLKVNVSVEASQGKETNCKEDS